MRVPRWLIAAAGNASSSQDVPHTCTDVLINAEGRRRCGDSSPDLTWVCLPALILITELHNICTALIWLLSETSNNFLTCPESWTLKRQSRPCSAQTQKTRNEGKSVRRDEQQETTLSGRRFCSSFLWFSEVQHQRSKHHIIITPTSHLLKSTEQRRIQKLWKIRSIWGINTVYAEGKNMEMCAKSIWIHINSWESARKICPTNAGTSPGH